RSIHLNSLRSNQVFQAVNCAAINENLLESELFGHEKGSFTGAVSEKKGLFEIADGGTLFLDEIGELDIALQAKLLRALQEREIRRVGGVKDIPVDVRVLAAT
ncbi:sigma-54 factor interaction domain-containing protein, partial [Escherichia coli]|nr:sigma-54 factor interaction domain-containing protein [Escherichia coli]